MKTNHMKTNQMKSRKGIQSTVLTLALATAGLLPLSAVEVTLGDPTPEGITYRWTVKMNAKDNADVDGTVGAWSWDEDAFPGTARGWTHTSNWVALDLTEDSRLTIKLGRKAGVPTTTNANNPDGVGLLNLFPAFTIYKGWQETGTDSHNFNNRGNIAWAADVEYLTHFENNGGTVAELTLKLKAGKYSVVLGGNSPSTLAEGRQGYGATFTTKAYSDPAELSMMGTRFRTSGRAYDLFGAIMNPESLSAIELTHDGRKIRARVSGSSWTAKVRELKPGLNRVTASALSTDGTTSGPVKIVIERTLARPAFVPTAPATPRLLFFGK
jgi:hypothetical protein